MDNQHKKIVIVDYRLGNLFSVQQACKKLGYDSVISEKKDDILSADALILPGVGAFAQAMKNLETLDLVSPLKDMAAQGKPLFGICLGLQLLFENSDEFGGYEGLGLVKGSVRKFPLSNEHSTKIRVPQIGWNKLIRNNGNRWDNTPLSGVGEDDYMYFVHSYYVVAANNEDILTYTNYNGIKYCSTISLNNIFATQYHPEKSAHKGIGIYKNWLNTI